jgi:hypothetical protein
MQRLSNYAPEGSIRRYLISCENADLKRSCNKGAPCRWRVRFTSPLQFCGVRFGSEKIATRPLLLR